MNDQTTQNDPVDRYDEGRFEVEKELRSIWLGRQSLFQTFDDDPDFDIVEIVGLLEESYHCLNAQDGA